MSRSGTKDTGEPSWVDAVRRGWFVVFPRPRRVVTGRDLVPLLLFLVAILMNFHINRCELNHPSFEEYEKHF